MKILGIDPGIAIVGYGVVEKRANKYIPIEYNAITTAAHTPLEDRLEIIYDKMNELLTRLRPDVMSVEELFFNNNAKTAFSVGQARGVILLAAVKHNLPYTNTLRFR